MTIDEAIKHNIDMAERYERFEDSHDEKLKEECLKSAAEYRQLSEWLKELTEYRKLDICGNCRHYVSGTRRFGECHATSDTEPTIVCVNQVSCETFRYKDFRNGARTE